MQLVRRQRTFEFSLKLEPLFQLPQVRLEFLDRLIALVNVLAQRLHHDPFKLCGQIRCEARNRRRIGFGDRHDHVRLGVPEKRRPAGRHFVEHNAEAPDVCAGVNGFAARLFGRHVLRRAHDYTGVGLHQRTRDCFLVGFFRHGPFRKLGKTKIQNLHVPATPDHYILRLDVAMNDAGGVSFFQRARDLNRGIHFREIHRRSAQALSQRHAVDKLGHDVMPAAFVTHFINCEDVWVIQSRSGISLLIEAAQAIAVLRQLFRQ